jgi:hypothetical protein
MAESGGRGSISVTEPGILIGSVENDNSKKETIESQPFGPLFGAEGERRLVCAIGFWGPHDELSFSMATESGIAAQE